MKKAAWLILLLIGCLHVSANKPLCCFIHKPDSTDATFFTEEQIDSIIAVNNHVHPDSTKRRHLINKVGKFVVDGGKFTSKVFEKTVEGTVGATLRMFDEKRDSVWISPNLYNYAAMIELSNWYEFYNISSSESSQKLNFNPNTNYKLGLYFGWKWIFLGYSIDATRLFSKQSSAKQEFELSIYTNMIGGDLYWRKSGNSHMTLTSYNGFTDDSYKGTECNALNVSMRGINAYYIFNHKHFSYPAAFSQSTNQRRSCGSFLLGFTFTKHELNFDHTKLPEPLADEIDSCMMFNRLKYSDYSINFGYAYNWVFKKNCLLSVSLQPAIGYKSSDVRVRDITMRELKHQLKYLSFDFFSRVGIVWNNAKYYTGISFVVHAYNYRRETFNVNNTYASLKWYTGFNFGRKHHKIHSQ